MYRKTHNGQLNIYDFILRFVGYLKQTTDGLFFERKSTGMSSKKNTARTLTTKTRVRKHTQRMLLLAPYTFKSNWNVQTASLLNRLLKNPYMHYFIGYNEYRNEKPFDSSLLLTFRKRFPEEVMSRIIEKMVIKAADADDHHHSSGGGGGKTESGADTEDPAGAAPNPQNKGTLIIDATCAPADIAFPTDLELSDKAKTLDRSDYRSPVAALWPHKWEDK